MKPATQLFREAGRRVLELSRPFKIALASLFLIVLLFLIFPFKITTVPAWNLRVMDELNRPLAGIHVTEHWQHYLLEQDGHEEIKISDTEGKVGFAERTIRASLLQRFFARLGKLTAKGQVSRTDRYASVVAWGSKNHETTAAVLKPDAPTNVLIVRGR